MSDPQNADLIDDVILALCEACAPGATVCPTDIAKSLAAREGLDASLWRSRLGAVRRAAVRLAQAGRIDVYRKGRPVDPSKFKGVYRIAARTIRSGTG